MINTHDNVWIPSDGYKYISNGDIWTDSIMLGNKDSIDNWYDTNEEPPEPTPPVDPQDQELADVIDDAEEMANELIGE